LAAFFTASSVSKKGISLPPPAPVQQGQGGQPPPLPPWCRRPCSAAQIAETKLMSTPDHIIAFIIVTASIVWILQSATNLHYVSKNAQTLASCSFDKHGLISIIFGKRHQHTFTNDMLFNFFIIHFYLFLFAFKWRRKGRKTTCFLQ